MCYTGRVRSGTGLVCAQQVMRPRRAVLQTPPKSSVPPGLLLHKNRTPRTPSESTLPQLLISLHFKSFISNAYKKPGGRCPASSPRVWQLVTPSTSRICSRTMACNSNPVYGFRTLLVTHGGGPPARPLTKLVIPGEPRDLLFHPRARAQFPIFAT